MTKFLYNYGGWIIGLIVVIALVIGMIVTSPVVVERCEVIQLGEILGSDHDRYFCVSVAMMNQSFKKQELADSDFTCSYSGGTAELCASSANGIYNAGPFTILLVYRVPIDVEEVTITYNKYSKTIRLLDSRSLI
jgi:hypothetical protein